jgi:uncharacterized protein YmfQ (DUF2313 family)
MSIAHTITKDGYIEIRVKLPTSGSLLEREEFIQEKINEAGCLLTEYTLKSLDTNGQAIKVGGKQYYSKGLEKKNIKVPTGK